MAQVLTGALAIIKLNGQPIGKMRNVRVSETISRGRVSGIGELTPQELPAQQWNGTCSCSFYSISFKNDGMAGSPLPVGSSTNPVSGISRVASSMQSWVDHVLLQDKGVDIDIYKKIQDAIDPNTGLLTGKQEPFARIEGLFLDRDGFDITENGISGRDQEFTYKNPIFFLP